MFYKIIHKVFQVDKHLIYFCFTLKFNKNLQLVKLLYYFSICTSDSNINTEIVALLGEIQKQISTFRNQKQIYNDNQVEIISDPTIITEIAQVPIHSTGIITIVENEATEQKIVGLGRIATIILTIITIETNRTIT